MPDNRVQPFLRWAGSKRQLLPVLSRYWHHECTRYIEPFAGSACLFFRLRPEQAILGDINAGLIATYREVRDQVDDVILSLATLKKGRDEYLALRETDPTSLTPADRAARFIYLNRFCFNGLYRTNLAGRFNVPYGGDKAGNLPSGDALRKASQLLRNAQLMAGDFGNVLELARPGDFVYMDPPFAVKSRRIFNEYDPSLFGLEDICRLRGWMEALSERNVPFLVSYADSEEADSLQEGFYTEMVTVRRNIAGFASSRVKSNEVLISNTHPEATWEE